MKRFLRTFLASFVVLAMLAGISPDFVQAVSGPSFFKKVGNAILPVSTSYTFGSASSRWNAFFDSADITTLTFGGFAPGDVTITGQLFVDDADGISIQTSATDRMFIRNTDSGFTSADQTLIARASGTGSGFWGEAGHLVFQARSNDSSERDIIFLDGDAAESFRFTAAGGFTVGGAAGTSGQVLTSAGSGSAPTWSTIAASASQFDATVCSSGCDYTDVQAAITGVGGTDIALVMLGNVTEDSDIAVPSGGNLVLHLGSSTLTMGNNAFTYSGAANVFLRSNGLDSGAEIDYTHTTSVALFNNLSHSTSVVDSDGIVFDNNSTADTTVIGRGIEKHRNCRVETPNQNLAGIFVGISGDYNIVSNCEFVGGGAAAQRGLSVSNSVDAVVENIYVTGTWSTTISQPSIQLMGDIMASNIYFITSSVTSLEGRNNTQISNVVNESGSDVDLYVNGTDGAYSNIDLGTGDIDLNAQDRNKFVNINVGTLDLTDTGAADNFVSNARVADAVTIGGDNTNVSNVDFVSGVTVAATADATHLSNIRGTVTDSGTNTIYFDGSAGGVSAFDASVCSSGCDYTDVQAAITGVGGTNIKLALKGNVTEDSDVVIPSGAYFSLYLGPYTWTMAANQVTFSGAADVLVYGDGPDSGAEIDYTQTVSNDQLFESPGAGSTQSFKGFTFDNNSSQQATQLASTRLIFLEDMTLDLPNFASTGVNMTQAYSYARDVTIIGGGTSTTNGLLVSGANSIVSDITVQGTWDSSQTPISVSGAGSTVNNITSNVSTNGVRFTLQGVVSNVMATSQTLDISTFGANSIYTNLDLNGGTFDPFGTDEITINGIDAALIDLSDTGALGIKISNAQISDATTIGGDNLLITNSDFASGITISSGADNNWLKNVKGTITDSGSGNRYDDHMRFDTAIQSDENLEWSVSESGTLTSKSAEVMRMYYARTHTAATTITDSYHNIEIIREHTMNNASGTYNDTGALIRLQDQVLPTSGTLSRTGAVLQIITDADGSNSAIEITGNVTDAPAVNVSIPDGDAHFRLVGDSTNGSPTEGDFWRESDGLKYYDGSSEVNLLSPSVSTVEYDASVCSSGCDYTDIQAAVTGVGGTDIKLVLKGSITENSDIAVPSGADLVINLLSYTLTMGNFHFTYSAAANVFVTGNGEESGAEIDYSPTSNDRYLFDNISYATSVVQLEGIKVDINTTNTNTFLSRAIDRFYNMTVEAGNATGTGIGAGVDGCIYENVTVVGGGTSSENAFYVLSDSHSVHASNMTFKGTFIASAVGDYAIIIADNTIFTGSIFDHDTAALRISADSATISDLSSNGGQAVDIYVTGLNGQISNIDLGGGTLDLHQIDDTRVSNALISTLDLTDGSLSNVLIDQVEVANAITVGGDLIRINNSKLQGGITFNSGADNNSVVNTQVGADAGAGSNTITVNSGSNGTVLVGNHTDAAISDSGTGTQTSANVTY